MREELWLWPSSHAREDFWRRETREYKCTRQFVNCAPGEADEHGINQILFCRNFCRPNSGRCCCARVSRLIRVESSVDLNAPRIIHTKHSCRFSPTEILTCWFNGISYNFDCYLWRGEGRHVMRVERWGNFVESKDWKKW